MLFHRFLSLFENSWVWVHDPQAASSSTLPGTHDLRQNVASPASRTLLHSVRWAFLATSRHTSAAAGAPRATSAGTQTAPSTIAVTTAILDARLWIIVVALLIAPPGHRLHVFHPSARYCGHTTPSL